MKATARSLRPLSKYFSSSISSKIITPYFVLTLLFTAFGIFVVTQLVVVGLEERLKNQLVDAGRIVSDEVVNREELRLETERLVANTEGIAEAVINRDYPQLNDLASPYIANSEDIDSIIIIDTQGKELLLLQRESDAPHALAQTELGSEVSYSSWPAVSKVLSNPDGSVKEIQLGRDPETGQLIIYTVGPINADSGIVGGVMVGTFLSKEIGALHRLALVDLTLFDENTNIIASTLVFNKDQLAEEIFASFTPERYQQVIEQQVIQQQKITLLDEVSVDTSNGPETYRVAYVPFMLRRRVAGIYAVSLPTNFITEQDGATRNQLIIIFSFGVAAVFGVGYLISQRIVKPILQLVSTSQAIARGDLTQRTGLQREDEIGILANTFDEMTMELQKKTNELEEEASKLNAILTSIADGVLVQDLAGSIVRMNPTAEQILQELEENYLYAPPSPRSNNRAGHHNKQEMSLLDAFTKLEFHEAQRFEMGERVLSALSAPVVANDGERLGSVIVLRDITREVEAERLKDDFITSISHELKTPLTAIKGYLELFQMMTPNKLNERELSWLMSSDKEVSDLDRLIQKMLDLSQIDAGELGTDAELFDLADLVEQETEKWLEKMVERKLSFEVQTSKTPIWIEGDWDKLSQVIYNLIENAHHYTLPGGEIQVLLKAKNGQAVFEVTDTGVGISTEDQRFLFTRFFRAIHEESTFEISGAGLGLYMSKAFIEAHKDGKIWMESQLNKGSKFYFSLPVVIPSLDEKKSVEYLKSYVN